MLHIIYSNEAYKILDYARRKKAVYPFIWLGNDADSRKENLYAYGMTELSLYEPDEKEKLENEKEYISTISMLNSEYDSLGWLAHGVSEKNEHISSHYRNIVFFYCLIETLKKVSDLTMHIFIIGNNEIFQQLKEYCDKNHIKIELIQNHLIMHIKHLFLKCRFFISILMLCIRAMVKKLYLDYTLGTGIKKEIDNTKDYYVIGTRLDARFLAKDGYSQDTLFGNLPHYALERGYKVFILARIPDDYFFKIVRKIKDTKNILILPEDYFLNYSDIWRLSEYLHFKKRRFRFTKKITFGESRLDVTKIYEREINKGYLNTEYPRNILTYFIAKNFARTVNFKTYVQTFENYAWEKLVIKGIKENKTSCKILGFQHAFITRNSFKYFFGDTEINRIPLPDKIITMGIKTRSILEKYGNYNKDILVTGCALRQEYIASTEPFKRRHFRRMVVPLTMARDEATLVLRFLYDSGLHRTENTVIIRPHPALPFEKLEKETRFRMPDNFIVSNQRSVKEELSESDMVLYTWSTVAVEALRLGLPVIYLDILKPMYVDPLFECSALKRAVAKKEELLPVIENIYNMPDEVFYKEQQIAQEYLKDYFYPVNANTLEPFLI